VGKARGKAETAYRTAVCVGVFGVIPFAIKNLLNGERDILAAPSAGGGPTKSHQLAFRNPLH